MKRHLLHRAAALAFAFACGLGAAGAAEPPRPDVIFIIADDLGWADVGFHGGPAPTPHLDMLARTGLELARHVVAPVCSPTRAALLTGRCWSRFGVVDPQNERALPWDTLTLPRALHAAGYDTCLTGKWHLGSRPDENPNRFGFQHSYGSLAGGITPYSHRYKRGLFTHTWHRDGRLLDEEGHATDLIAAEAVRWIEGHARKDSGRPPYFLYVPFTAVHLPVREPVEWLARVPKDIAGEVPRHYAACVMHLDDAVGRILRAVDAAGTRERTLLVFTSDNGASTAANTGQDYPDDGCPAGDLPGDNRPFRGRKETLYEGGVRVPTLVSWPGHVKPGRVEDAVQIADWMPTICRLAGFKPDRDPRWDGTDIGPVLERHEPLPERPIYAVGPGWKARSLRLGRWKLIVAGGADDGPEQVELFDLAADPAESKNLATNQPEDLARLWAALDAAAAHDRDAMATDAPQP